LKYQFLATFKKKTTLKLNLLSKRNLTETQVAKRKRKRKPRKRRRRRLKMKRRKRKSLAQRRKNFC